MSDSETLTLPEFDRLDTLFEQSWKARALVSEAAYERVLQEMMKQSQFLRMQQTELRETRSRVDRLEQIVQSMSGHGIQSQRDRWDESRIYYSVDPGAAKFDAESFRTRLAEAESFRTRLAEETLRHALIHEAPQIRKLGDTAA